MSFIEEYKKRKEIEARKSAESFSDRYKRRKAYENASERTIQTDIDELNKKINSLYSGWKSGEEIESVRSGIESINDRLSKIRDYYEMDGDGSEQTAAYLKNIGDAYNSYSEILGGLGEVQDYYGQFADLNDYTAKMQAQEEARKAKEERASVYTNLKNNDDWASKVAEGRSYADNTTAGFDQKWYGLTYRDGDIGNKLMFIRDNSANLSALAARNLATNAGNVESITGGKISNFDIANGKTDEITDEQIDIYSYLLATQDEEGAEEYLKYLRNNRIEASNEQLYEAGAEIAKNGKALSTVFSVALNLGSPVEFAVQGYHAAKGDLDDNMNLFGLNMFENGIRETRGEAWAKSKLGNWQIPLINANAGELAYGSMTSVLDMLATFAVGGAVANYSGALGGTIAEDAIRKKIVGGTVQMIMSSSAGSGTLLEAKNRGLSDAQALGLGFGSAIAEWVTEKYSIEAFLSDPKNALSYAIKNFVAEGSEEIASDIINDSLDLIISGDKAELRKVYEEYVANGDSPETAKAKTVWYATQGMLASGLAGGVSGAAMGVGGLARNAINVSSNGRNIRNNGNSTKLIEESMKLDENSDAYKLAKEISEKNKKSNNYNIGKLYGEYARESTRSAVDARVKSLGGDQTAADAVNKKISGEDINFKEKRLIKKNAAANRTLKEFESYGTEKSDQYSNQWVKDMMATRSSIATDREVKIANAYADKQKTAEKYTVNTEWKTINKQTGEEVRIAKENPVVSNDNGSLMLRTEDGGTVNADAIGFASKGESYLYATIADMGVEADVANQLVSLAMSSDSKKMVSTALGLQYAYWYGSSNIRYEELEKADFTRALSEAQRKIAYNLGKENAIKRSAKTTVSESGEYTGEYEVTSRGVKGHQFKNLNEMQKSGIDLARALTKLGAKIYFFESTDEQRKAGKENGSYVGKDGTIHVDINSGKDGSGTVAYTLTHEFVHSIEDFSQEKFKAYADILIEELGVDGKTVSSMLQSELGHISNMKEYGNMSEEELREIAYSEVIAKLSEKMFTDTDALNKIAEKIHETDKTLWQKIVDFFTKVAKALQEVYGGKKAYNSPLADEAIDTIKRVEKIRDAFANAAVDSLANQLNATTTESKQNAGSVAFSLRENGNISDRSIAYYNSHKGGSASHISDAMFTEANNIINEMTKHMMPYLDITNNNGKRYLPEEILGTTTFSNGSYGRTIENTTICFRTLAYIDFTNEIKKRIGRPLTVEESFLASQMLYDIAKEPQCLYCYVSLDRKAYDGFLLEYIKQRDGVLDKFASMEDKSKKNIDKLYTEFLAGRKDTKPMRQRFNLWINSAINGKGLISLSDLTTEEVRSNLKSGELSAQINDAERYAQSASWAKKLEQYRSYNSDILRMSDATVRTLNAHYGLRFYSFSEYTPAFIVENMQQIRDASLKGLYGLAYTKKTDFARIFANTGMNINISVFGKMKNGKVVADTRQGADWGEVQELRNQYKNVGAVFVATSDELTEWALAQDWIDVVIPFHIVRTGANVAEFYKWTNNTKFQADVDKSGKNKTISPAEHHNDLATFKRLIAERELTPRFEQFIDNPNYMKLVNETRLADTESVKLSPNFTSETLREAKKSFDAFVNDGGYYGDWYNDGIDYEKAVNIVAEDVLNGKRANEVSYGRQDLDIEDQKEKLDLYKKNPSSASHGRLLSDRDSDGNELSAQQMEYFKDSKVRDENGNLLVVYHGTPNDFTVFDGGAFFTDDYYNADGYAGGENVLESYLKIDRPLVIDCNGRKWDDLNSKYGKSTREVVAKASRSTYDGVIFKNINDSWTDDEDGDVGNVYYVFDSEQAKLTSNKNPTSDPDIRYSLRDGAEEEVEKALNNKDYRNNIILTNGSPSIITSQKGTKNLPMAMNASHIRENVFTKEEAKEKGLKVDNTINYHGLGKDLFLKIIGGLDDVVLAYRGTEKASNSSRRTNYFLLISQYKDQKGNIVNVPVYVNVLGQYNKVFIETNKIATVFGKDNFYDYIQKEIRSGNLVRIKKESIRAGERTAPIAAGYGGNASTKDSNTSSSKSQGVFAKKSERNDVGYHAGDLGKAEYLSQQGAYRDTGHFGTGTYFVGNKESVTNSSYYGKRPQHAVDFSNYRLYKVYNDKQGYRLHDALRVIDGGIEDGWIELASNMDFNAIDPMRAYKIGEDKFGEDWYIDKNLASSYIEFAKENGIKVPSEEEFMKKYGFESIEDEDYYFYYKDFLKENIDKSVSEVNDRYGRFRDAYRDLEMSFHFNYNAINNALKSVVKYQNETNRNEKSDSYATVFMKAMGYEGVDVRGTGLDNTTYGSVVYDLNRDSVLYSEREGVSERTLLSSALETATQNDAEKAKLQEYKTKIGLMDAEEGRLRNIKASIKELSFAKGKRDMSKIAELKKEAQKIENRINQYDKQLLTLEASEPLKNVLNREYEKARKKAQNKFEQESAEYKRRTAERISEIIKRNQESRHDASVKRNTTAVRNKVRRIISELNSYLKDNKVMIVLQKPVALALDAINMDSVGAEERVAKYNELIAKTTDEAMKEELIKTRDNIAKQGDNLADKLSLLKTAYGEIINSDDPMIAASHDEVIENMISQVIKDVGNTPIRNMNLEQLDEVYNMYKAILTRIRDANKAFKIARNATITELSTDTAKEIAEVGGYKPEELTKAVGIKRFFVRNKKPIYLFRMIGSKTFLDLFYNLRSGEDTWYKDVHEAQQYIKELYKTHKYAEWDFDERHEFESNGGSKFELSLEQIMSIYAYSKRDNGQGLKHLVGDGFTFGKNQEVKKKGKVLTQKYTIKTGDAYSLTEQTALEIIDTLTEDQKSYVDEMVKFLSEVMGEKGNEVSLALYGVKMFTEKYYFPLVSSSDYIEQNTKVVGEKELVNSGFTKRVVTNARNPVVLEDFTDVWARHVDKMSMYHAFVLPLEDITRVWNYHTRATAEDEGVDATDATSVKGTITNAYGEYVNDYIHNLLVDVNGGVKRSGAEEITKLVSLAKKGAVYFSLSVTIQQPTSVARAMAYINPIDFVATTPNQFNFKTHRSDWEECKKYAPIAGVKEMGYFDTGISQSAIDWIKERDYEGFQEKVEAFFKDGSYRDEVLTKAPSLADEITWVHIWNAVKHETERTTDLQVGTKEFLEECGRKFTDVIMLTQVYDSVFSRSELMRSKDTGMKVLTAFMAESTTALNMIEDAVLQAKRVGGKEGAKIIAKTVGAVVGSIVLNALLKSLVTAWRHLDEDKPYGELYKKALVEDLIDNINLLNYIPIAKDIVSLFQGFRTERMEMTLFEDLVSALKGISSSRKSTYQKVTDMIGAISAFLGVPIKNIERDLRPIIKKIIEILKGEDEE